MDTFLEIMMYSAFVFGGLSAVAAVFALMGKFLSDITHDPDAVEH